MEHSYEVLDALTEAQQNRELSIITLSEPISSAIHETTGTRTSDVSSEGAETPTPASLEADLTHYKV